MRPSPRARRTHAHRARHALAGLAVLVTASALAVGTVAVVGGPASAEQVPAGTVAPQVTGQDAGPDAGQDSPGSAPQALAALEQAESFAAGELDTPDEPAAAPSAGSRLRALVLGRRAAPAPDATPDTTPDTAPDTAPDTSAGSDTGGERVDGTLLMREVFRLRGGLRGDDQLRAEQVLARPSDRGADPLGDGWTAPSRRACTRVVCVHWVGTTEDRATRAWARRTLRVVDQVWRTEVDQMGYRRPVSDGRRGGDSRFDVYLKDLGTTGAYGYCAPESRAPGGLTASGYCVLDNDFSPRQYAGNPAAKSLRVTAAHEFFHAVQFAYDYAEDLWFAETTAVWMEEQVMGGINDNRQYLPFGQLVDPAGSLDRFDVTGLDHYGNWIFWQHLSDRFGPRIVKQAWEAAAARPGRDLWSTRALSRVLRGRGGLPAVFAEYASATTDARRAYREGRRWPAPGTAGTLVAGPTASRTVTRIDHLASASYVVRPDAALTGRAWRLRVRVDAPRRATSPAVVVRVTKRDGRVVERTLRVGRDGRARVVVPFGTRVPDVTVTLANASTRSRCWRGSWTFSCQGRPRDDRARFALTLQAVRR